MTSALDFELNRIKVRFEEAFKRLQDIAKQNSIHAEIIRRVLTSRVLYDAQGAFNKDSYGAGWEDGPLGRMEFLTFFICHELLDDGDPGLGWHKYNIETGIYETCSPPKNLESQLKYDLNDPNWNARPFWHCCHEILPPNSKHLYEQDVIWVLDWHEQHEELRYSDRNFNFNNEQRKPEDPMLIELANQIVGEI